MELNLFPLCSMRIHIYSLLLKNFLFPSFFCLQFQPWKILGCFVKPNSFSVFLIMVPLLPIFSSLSYLICEANHLIIDICLLHTKLHWILTLRQNKRMLPHNTICLYRNKNWLVNFGKF